MADLLWAMITEILIGRRPKLENRGLEKDDLVEVIVAVRVGNVAEAHKYRSGAVVLFHVTLFRSLKSRLIGIEPS